MVFAGGKNVWYENTAQPTRKRNNKPGLHSRTQSNKNGKLTNREKKKKEINVISREFYWAYLLYKRMNTVNVEQENTKKLTRSVALNE